MRKACLFIAVGWTVATCALVACAGEVQKPVVHFIEPGKTYTDRADALIAHAALRLAGAELAARYHVATRYWPVEDASAIPDDAYPRITASQANIATAGFLRLKRVGGEIVCLGQRIEREPEVELWRGRINLPPKTYVGLLAPTNSRDKGKVAVFADVTLNGKPVQQWNVRDMGPVAQPGTLRRDGQSWILSAAGQAKDDAQEPPATFAYIECTGDFDLRAKVVSVEGEGDPLFAGLVCRTGWGPRDVMIGPMTRKSWSGVLCRLENWKHAIWGRDFVGHLLALDLHLSPQQKKLILVRSVSYGSWNELTDHVEGAEKTILKALAAELKLNVDNPRSAAPATAEQLEELNAARQQTLRLAADQVLAASRRIDAILDTSPTCGEAHSAAAFCGAMLACQDLMGRFDRRDRTLAGPLAHLLLARRLNVPQTLERKLDEAWMMLATGYPDSAGAAVKALGNGAAEHAEANALRMFVTRDYQRLDDQKVRRAKPIEQLAWVWAVQDCGCEDYLLEAPTRMALQAKAAALLPLYASDSVDAGHVNSLLLMALAFHADANALLSCEELPLEQRATAARKMATALGLNAAGDLETLRDQILAGVLRNGLGDQPFVAASALMQLYQSARQQHIGPQVLPEGTRWRTLSLRDYAETQRGLFLLAVERRAVFMGSRWGVDEEAVWFCDGMSRVLTEPSGAAEYMAMLGQGYGENHEAARQSAQAVLRSDLGRSASFRAMHYAGARQYEMALLAQAAPHPPGRGAWEWGPISTVGGDHPNWEWSACAALRTVNVDAQNSLGAYSVAWLGQNPRLMQPLAQAMPYHIRLRAFMAGQAEREGNVELAIRTLAELILAQPKNPDAYWQLAHLYLRVNQRKDAIETVQTAVKNCPYTVTLSNLMGRCAQWLVAEGRIQEAVRMGRQAAQSYGSRGLQGLAAALEASGQIEEATEVYRAAAARYDSDARELIEFLIRQKQTPQQIVKAMQALVGEHGQKILPRINRIVFGGGHHRLLEALYNQNVLAPSQQGPDHSLLICAMYARDFDGALVYSQRIAAQKPRSVAQLIWSHIAVRCGGKGQNLADLERELRQHRSDRDLGSVVRCVLGELPKDQLLQGAQTDMQRAYAHWLAGIDAERKGELPQALEHYRTASALYADTQACHMPRKWLAALQPQTPNP